MKYLLRYIILLILFIVVGWLVFVPVNHLGASLPYIEAVEEGHTFDAKELQDFLDIWHKADSGYAKNYMPSASLDVKSRPSNVFLWWLRLHDWNAQRFFYNEQRLRGLVNCVELRNDLDGNLLMQKEGGAKLDELLKMQKHRLKACDYDENEMELIANNINTIKALVPGVDKK